MGQELNFHPHIHCIVSGGGLTKALQLKTCGKGFFLPAKVIAKKFRGKLLANLRQLHSAGKLVFSSSCENLGDPHEWGSLIDRLYKKEWCPDIRETFNGFGNAIEYLGRYTHRIAITNTRIVSVSGDGIVFTAKDYKNNSIIKDVKMSPEEFVRRMMMHVLPGGFQKIRYYGFLNNRSKKKNLDIIFRIQGHRLFTAELAGLSMSDVLKKVWNYDISICPVCGHHSMRLSGRTYAMRC